MVSAGNTEKSGSFEARSVRVRDCITAAVRESLVRSPPVPENSWALRRWVAVTASIRTLNEETIPRRIFFEFPDSRLRVKSMLLDCFQNHKAVGDFRQGDNGCDPFNVTDLYPLEKCCTRAGQRAAGEMVNEDVGINKNAATRR